MNTSPQNFRKLIVCEGEEDRIFFSRLIEKRGLQKCTIISAGSKDNYCGCMAKYKFEQIEKYQKLEHVLFVADNDDKPQERFNNVCAQIRTIFGPESVPKSPRETVGKDPKVTVLMIPWDKTEGHLESLCLQAAKSFKGDIPSIIDQFMATVKADKWHQNKASKAWLRSYLAVVADDPFIPLGRALRDSKPKDLIPLEHKSFDEVAEFLAKLK